MGSGLCPLDVQISSAQTSFTPKGAHDWLTGCGDSHVPSFPMARGQGKGWELSNEALLNLMFCSSSEKGNLTTGGEWVLFWRRNHEEHKEVENDLFFEDKFLVYF